MWQIRTDTGGTFTDCFAVDPDGRERRVKVLSSGVLRSVVDEVADGGRRLRLGQDWGQGDGFFRGFRMARAGSGDEVEVVGWTEGWFSLGSPLAGLERGGSVVLHCGESAPVLGARLLTGTAPGGTFPELELRLATTRGTNALLEGKGAPVVLFTNEGLGDLLRIGDQRREDLFALYPEKRESLDAHVVEVSGRHASDGGVLEEPDFKPVAAVARELLAADSGRVAAVALLHADVNDEHEKALKGQLLEAGFSHVSQSSELAPVIGLLARGQTAVVNATLAPIMESFLDGVTKPLTGRRAAEGGGAVMMMRSAGGLETLDKFAPKDSLLSGPAAGVIGALAVARAAGREKVITLDMGGTSTDVARIDGGISYQFEHRVGPARLIAPSVRIETVAAGGGSICRWENGRLQVGPESAGAHPGPACYGNGGPLTLTDVNLLLGLFDPSRAPIPLDPEAARAAFGALRDAMEDEAPSEKDLLEGLRRIAVERMADAIRVISTREGVDPADYALLAFGGAGPQHAVDVADCLGMEAVLVPGDAGLLSAWGLHNAVVEGIAVRQVLGMLAEVDTGSLLEELEQEAVGKVAVEEGGCVEVRRRLVDMRLPGQDSVLTLDFEPDDDLVAIFAEAYEKLYHYRPPEERGIELVKMTVVASEPPPEVRREEFADGRESVGPELIQDSFSTCVLPEGWVARRGCGGTLLLERRGDGGEGPVVVGGEAVERELFRARFTGIVEDMGALLRRTALSTNIKERLDYSCALLDDRGFLVVNAPHIPVHLGAMGLCVRRVAEVIDFRPGDVVVTNHPAMGGSHLPDVTLIAPVHDGDGRCVAWLANRAHHAELGGIRPGSMPPDGKCLSEEGVVLDPVVVHREGGTDWQPVLRALRDHPHPTRSLADNEADLRAQLASVLHARAAYEAMLREHGEAVVGGHLRGIGEQVGELCRKKLAGLGLPASARAEIAMDDGHMLRVDVGFDSDNGRLRVDFSGSDDEHPGNFNTPPAIVHSAVLYVLRLIMQEDIPLNEGLLDPVNIVLREGSFLNPRFPDNADECPAVVAGNVETSQHVVLVLLRALEVQAASQGTMNNVLFGNARFGYYETIGGGTGGGPGGSGASGVHSHMTNTAITDTEVLERRYPVRLRAFALRHGSGGEGTHPGGDGLVREYEWLDDLDVSLLTSHRTKAPFGMGNGGDGLAGKNIRIWPDGRRESLAPLVHYRARAGERLRIETPGGGGSRA